MMFLAGSGDVCPTGRGFLRAEADFELLGAVAKAVTDIFAGHRAEIPQSCGMLDMEEATGYLAADCLGRVLIDVEARGVGKRANYRLGACAEKIEKAEGSAKKRISKVRAKASDAQLEARLAVIETEKASAISEVYDATYDLKLPDRRSKVVVKEVKPEPVVDPVAALAQAAEMAVAEHAAAALGLSEILRETAKTKKQTLKELQASERPPAPNATTGAFVAWTEERQYGMDLMREVLKIEKNAKSVVHELELDAMAATCEARRAALDAQIASAVAEAEAEKDTRTMELELERLASEVRMEALDARIAASQAATRATLRDSRPVAQLLRPDWSESVLFEHPHETRARLEADAERVWGTGWQERT
jgi:hypothetical protein